MKAGIHPEYAEVFTGKQKMVDTAGRVGKFRDKYKRASKAS